MVKLIMGLKGSGKTKQLVTDINEAVKNETGSMVCIEKGTKLRYEIARMQAADEALQERQRTHGILLIVDQANADINIVTELGALFDADHAAGFCLLYTSFQKSGGKHGIPKSKLSGTDLVHPQIPASSPESKIRKK